VSVAPAIQHARALFYFTVACPAIRHFSTLPHKRHDFRENVIEHKICVFIFSTTLSETMLILRRIQRDIITNVHWSSSKVPVILVTLQSQLNILERFSKNTQISNLTKIRPVGAEFHMDGRTDRQTWRSY